MRPKEVRIRFGVILSGVDRERVEGGVIGECLGVVSPR